MAANSCSSTLTGFFCFLTLSHATQANHSNREILLSLLPLLGSICCCYYSPLALFLDILLLWSPVRACAEMSLLSFPFWNETVKSLSDTSFAISFTTACSKAICLWSVWRVNTVMGVKPKVAQTLKTLIRFSCAVDKGNKVLCQAKWS